MNLICEICQNVLDVCQCADLWDRLEVFDATMTAIGSMNPLPYSATNLDENKRLRYSTIRTGEESRRHMRIQSALTWGRFRMEGPG